MVRDDRKRLQRRLRELPCVPAHDKRLDLIMEGRMGEEPPAPGDLAKLEATVCVRVLGCQIGKGLRSFARGNAEHRRKVSRADGVA